MNREDYTESVTAELLNAMGDVWQRHLVRYKSVPWWKPRRKLRAALLLWRYDIAFTVLMDLYGAVRERRLTL